MSPRKSNQALHTPRRAFLATSIGVAVSLAFGGKLGAQTLKDASIKMQKTLPLPVYGHDPVPVWYRRPLPVGAPRARYPGFEPSTQAVRAGTVRRKGAKPLPCDIVFERDVAVKMRDGTTIYTDVFRPAREGTFPGIVAWSPYGKEIGGQWLDDIPGRSGVPLEWVSELQKFEGPDPAFWVNQGYVVLNPDPRGAYNSEGNISYWGRQLSEDGYDFIEWAARQQWCSGKLGMAGNSWLAVSQWFIAAEQPPHLAAIAPWEGFTDHFRDAGNRGGIPAPGFPEAIIKTFAGKGLVEDQPRMIVEQQLMCAYWEDKRARLERISIPAYVVASYTNAAHTHGSFDGFRRIQSREKWLRVNNTNEWLDFYTARYTNELLQFFDRYLKDKSNGWESTPRVRICVLNPGGADEVDRVEDAWPLARAVSTKLYLGAGQTLSAANPIGVGQVSYPAAPKGMTEFTVAFDRPTEITGYMKLRLWVEASGSDDMELAVAVEKRDREGNAIHQQLGEGMSGAVSATGLLRVSQRELDVSQSTELEPYLLHQTERKLRAGEVVPVDIPIWPMSMKFAAGERLHLTISAHFPIPTSFDMGFGTAPIEIPVRGTTFKPAEAAQMLKLGGPVTSSPAYVDEERVPTPTSRNRGAHIIHFGGEKESFLAVPLIPG